MKIKKTLLITGANRGIGLAITKSALEKNIRVIACHRTSSSLHPLYAISDENLKLQELDVTDDESIKRVSSNINTNIDFLVCNAGINNGNGTYRSDEHTRKNILDVFNVNFVGPLYTIRNFINKIKVGGKIILISSDMGRQNHSGSNSVIYRASKAALNNLMISISNELKSKGIIVTAFHPGWVKTDMGGPYATLRPEESAKHMMDVFLKLKIDQSGMLLNYDGSILEL